MIIGTILYTWLNGELVGADEFGNRYYHTKKDRLHGAERRWVIYKGRTEASSIPSEWHAWLHHTVAQPLTENAARGKSWQKPHVPNLTGTPQSYYPGGHDKGDGQPVPGNYQPWVPQPRAPN